MLSFGIELSRAFWTAFASARFASGSAPPSRAATMIARVNFEKSCPRLASAAPFLCLIDDHLLCPDIAGNRSRGYALSAATGSPRRQSSSASRARKKPRQRNASGAARGEHEPEGAEYGVAGAPDRGAQADVDEAREDDQRPVAVALVPEVEQRSTDRQPGDDVHPEAERAPRAAVEDEAAEEQEDPDQE